MGRGKDPKQYDAFIQAIVNDLQINEVHIHWRATWKANVAGVAYPNNHVYLLKNPENVYEFESVEHLRYEVLRVIAHELRHIWQFQNKKLVTGKVWKWEGKETKVNRIMRGKVPDNYQEQPWEDDANTYARLAILKFSSLVKEYE